MGLKDFVKGVTDKVSHLTPDPLEDLVFGKRTSPPAPTTPEQAQALIDSTIGRLPEDQKIVEQFHAAKLTSQAIQAFDVATEGYFSMAPFDPATQAKWATGSLPQLADPYTIADMDLQRIFQSNPRAAAIYAREYDPLNKELLPVLVEANAKRHGGLLSFWKNTVSEIGRAHV